MRYGVHPESDGSLRLEVTDASTVWFNGIPGADGIATFVSLAPGSEVLVFIEHNGTRRA